MDPTDPPADETLSSDGSTAATPVLFTEIKVPAFMETSPAAWFAIIESQFHLRGIKLESTKFHHALSALKVDVVASLPPTVLTNHVYSELKTEVLQLYEHTKPELFEQLISSTHLHGRPSAYLTEITQIARKVGVAEDLVRHKFLQSVPSNIAPVLATQKDLILPQLGRLADELVPFKTNAPFGASANVSASAVNFNQAQTKNKNSAHGEDYKNLSRAVRPFSANQRPKVCRAHIYFGDKCESCRPWCKWPDKSKCKVYPLLILC